MYTLGERTPADYRWLLEDIGGEFRVVGECASRVVTTVSKSFVVPFGRSEVGLSRLRLRDVDVGIVISGEAHSAVVLDVGALKRDGLPHLD